MKMLKSAKSTMLLAAVSLAAMLGVNPVFAADEPADPPTVQEQAALPEVPKAAPAHAAETAAPAATMQNVPAAPDPADTSASPVRTATPAAPAPMPAPAPVSAKSAAKNPVAAPAADQSPDPASSTVSTSPVAESAAPAPAGDANALLPEIPSAQPPVVAAAAATGRSGVLRIAAEIILACALLALFALGIAGLIMTRNLLARQGTMMQQSLTAKKTFWTSGSLRQGVANLEADSPFRYIAELGLRAFEHNQTEGRGKIGGRVWVASVIRHACENVQGSLQQGPAGVADVGMAALLVGLLGAACGGYAALTGFDATSGAASAGFAIPLGGALLSAILGFGIAVSSMSNRERLDRGNSAYLTQVRSFCADLRMVLCGDAVANAPMPMAAGAN
jgi:biopolymer transport protein ExbB